MKSLRPMVVLVDARTLASCPTGVGMYVVRLLRKFITKKEFMNGEVARFVLVCDVKESVEVRTLAMAGCEVRVYGKHVFNSIGIISYFRFVKCVIAEVKPDVFWQPNNLQPFRPKGVGCVIVSMHDVFGLKDWSWRYALWHFYYWFSFGRTLRNATEIWFNSKETECFVRAVAPKRIAAVRTKVVYPPIEVPRRENVVTYPHERQFFLYLGNIEVRKGVDTLIAAYERYREASRRAGSNPFDLIFAGIEKNIVVPRTEGIYVLGYVDDTTKFSLMCSCVAMVVPSRAEGYGMQVAEAAALGVKCFASDLSVFREIDSTGRVVFPVGSITKLTKLLLGSGARDERLDRESF